MHAGRVLTPIEQPPSGLLHSLYGGIDALDGAVRKVDAEVLPATLLTDPLAFVIGRREVQREGVAAVRGPEEHDRSVSETSSMPNT